MAKDTRRIVMVKSIDISDLHPAIVKTAKDLKTRQVKVMRGAIRKGLPLVKKEDVQ